MSYGPSWRSQADFESNSGSLRPILTLIQGFEAHLGPILGGLQPILGLIQGVPGPFWDFSKGSRVHMGLIQRVWGPYGPNPRGPGPIFFHFVPLRIKGD